ncbi:MAG: hypothetical protein ISS92_06925 [Candidatus Omnitrophica bacterium]|nr:hypothetical protein [Candidatus Omnitrophota bacterium]
MVTKRCAITCVIFVYVCCVFSFSASAGPLFELMAVGESQKAMEKELAKETKAYKTIKKAIEKGLIKKGESADEIRRRYGAPVITLSDEQYAEKWVYKPGYASYFDGIKIYLFFDSDKTLKGIRVMSGVR